MTKLTTEVLKEIIGSYPENSDEIECVMASQLLAYEQAARNSDLKTLVISEIVDFYSGFESPCEPETVDEAQRQLIGRIEKVFGLAAPVLPKQSELLSIGELLQRLEEQTGEKWIEESAQPAIPGQLTLRMAEEKALSLGAVLYDEEADVFADGWNACRAEMLKAQPASEPKLPNSWIKGQFAYQDLFNAIGAAVVSKHPSIEISVKAFEDSMLAVTQERK